MPLVDRRDAEVARIGAAAAGLDDDVRPVDQRQDVGLQRHQVPRRIRHRAGTRSTSRAPCAERSDRLPRAVEGATSGSGSSAARRCCRVAPAPSAASSGSPTNMPSTSGARSIDAAGVVEACGPKQNIGAPKWRFSFAISATSASSVGVVLGNRISVGLKPSRSSCAIEICDRAPLGGQIDEADVAPRVAQHRGEQRQRVGRLGRAEHLLALLAASLAGEGDAVHERRVDEQRLSDRASRRAPPSRESRGASRDVGRRDRRNRRQLDLAAPPADRENPVLEQLLAHVDVALAVPHLFERGLRQVADLDANERAEDRPCRRTTRARAGTDTGSVPSSFVPGV